MRVLFQNPCAFKIESSRATGFSFKLHPARRRALAAAFDRRALSFAGIPAIPPGHHARTMRKHIRIDNPVSGCGFTSKNRARRFVAQGRAEWVEPGVSIRFIQSDHRHTSAQKSADTTRYWYERAANTGLAQLSELANLPMITPGVLLGFGKRKGASRHTFLANRGL